MRLKNISRLSYSHRDTQNFAGRVLSHLGRGISLPNLKTLRLSGLRTSVLDSALFAQILGGLPSVTSLTLSHCSSRFAETLTVTPTSNLCPLLEKLGLVKSSIERDSLMALARSRSKLNPSAQPSGDQVYLTQLRLPGCAGVDGELVEALEALSIKVYKKRRSEVNDTPSSNSEDDSDLEDDADLDLGSNVDSEDNLTSENSPHSEDNSEDNSDS